eukprot:COSAG05_NODE_16232_length_350_cov_1.446215_2_plen_49_part_01
MEPWHVVLACCVAALGALCCMAYDLRARWLPERALSNELRKERLEKRL